MTRRDLPAPSPPARRLTRLLVALLLLAAGTVSLPAAARADGDPASDILISQDVFYPYAPNTVAKELQGPLNRQLAAAKRAGFPMKIALIASVSDLGSVPQLFTEPQKYADLLTTEISFNTKPRVLVVLPAGLGGNNLGDDAGPALSNVSIEAAAGADGLARAAMQAVGALTKANGTPVPVPAVALERGRAGDVSADGGGGGVSPLLVFGLPVALVALLAGLAAVRDRRRSADTGDDAPADDAPANAPADDDAGDPTPAQ